MGPAQFDPEVLEDGRMRCIYCGRFFNPDRIDKHQAICGKLKSARPKGVDGQPTQTEAKVFDAAAQRTGKGSAFVSPEQYQRRQQQRMAAVKAMRKTAAATSWRRQHAEFQAACHAGRDDGSFASTSPPAPAPPGSRGGLVPCPHCSRQFEPNAAERHIPICAKVLNRPRPPPTPAKNPPTPASKASWHCPPTQSAAAAWRQSPAASARHAMTASVDSLGTLDSAGNSRPPTGREFSPQRSTGSSHGRTTGGAGLNAARSLRQRQQPAESPPPPPPPPVAERRPRSERRASPAMRQEFQDAARPQSMVELNQTVKKEDTFRPPVAATASATQRMGLRRSALLYRLLSQLPAEALAQELGSCGVDAGSLDQEEMIEALAEQLA